MNLRASSTAINAKHIYSVLLTILLYLLSFFPRTAHQTYRLAAKKCERLRNGGRSHVSHEHHDIPSGWQKWIGPNEVHGIR